LVPKELANIVLKSNALATQENSENCRDFHLTLAPEFC